MQNEIQDNTQAAGNTQTELQEQPKGPATLQVWQVYYDDKSRRVCDAAFTPYDNTGCCDVFFENSIIAELAPQSQAHYTGVLSWKFGYKTGKRGAPLLQRIAADDAADVYSFSGAARHKNVWQQAEAWHKGIIRTAQMIFDALGYADNDITKLATPVIWQNHFIARTAVYAHYIDTILRPAMQYMRSGGGPALQEMLWADSGYMRRELRGSATLRQRLTDICGRPYYPLHPFICERFFSTYMALNPDISLKSLK